MAPTATPEPTSTPTPTPTQEVIPEYPEWVGEYGGVQWTRYQLYPQNRAVVIEGTYYQAVPGGYDLQAEGTNGIYLFFVEAPEVCPLTKFETIGPHLNNIGTDVVTRFGYVPSGDPDFGPTLYVDPGGSNNWACGWDMVFPVIKTATPTPTNTVTMEPTTPPVVMSTPVPAVTAIPTPDWASYDEWPANYEVGWVIPEEWVIGQDENGYVLLLSGTYYYPDTVNPTQPQPIGVGRTFVFHEDVSTTCNYPLFETVGNFLASTEGQVMIVPFNQPYFHEVAFGFAGSDWNCGWQKWNNN